jgi:hypothetical protein
MHTDTIPILPTTVRKKGLDVVVILTIIDPAFVAIVDGLSCEIFFKRVCSIR